MSAHAVPVFADMGAISAGARAAVGDSTVWVGGAGETVATEASTLGPAAASLRAHPRGIAPIERSAAVQSKRPNVCLVLIDDRV
jgi:hypothetical protein